MRILVGMAVGMRLKGKRSGIGKIDVKTDWMLGGGRYLEEAWWDGDAAAYRVRRRP